MNSKITIEVDFNNDNLPCIKIMSRQSDDIRDKLIKNFLEILGHTSSWLKIRCDGIGASTNNSGYSEWTITPIAPNELREQGDVMIEQHRLNQPQTSI